MWLRQGNRRVANYAIDFRTLASESEWNPAAFTDAFLEGLSEELKDHLAPLELPSSLESLIAQAIRIDNQLQDRRRECRGGALPHGGGSKDQTPQTSHASLVVLTEPSSPPLDEPMWLGRGGLSSSEHKRQMTAGECLSCGKRGNFCKDCPNAVARN